MNSIQTILLVALGFLTAGLLVLALAPAFWSRAVRLTTKRLKDSLPISEDEVRADKDRLRADFAIRTHKLEMRVEQAELTRARHLVDLSRRDVKVSQLEGRVGELSSQVDEHQNARLVLEQTISDRLPRVEQRLNEAKELLFNRDREIAELTQSTNTHRLALEEAKAINAQQASEIERMSNALTTRGARNHGAMHDPKYEAELALRSEIEALRAKTREQAAMIARLQANNAANSAANSATPAAFPTPGPASGATSGATGPALVVRSADPDRAVAERELARFKSRAADQDSEIVRLKAELMGLRAESEQSGAMKDSRIAIKARLSAAEAEVEQQVETIKKLRAELTASQEQNAQQAQHFMDEMRRLGAGTMPVAGQHQRPAGGIVRRSLAERVSQSRPATLVANTTDKTDAASATATADTTGVNVAAETDPQGNGSGMAQLPAPAAANVTPSRPRLFDRIQSLSKT